MGVWLPLQQQADYLRREARIPLRWRSPAGAPRELALVVPLRPVLDLDAGMESLIPAGVRVLLTEVA